MAINHHNFEYAAGPTFPEDVGDRYYTQDLGRDYWSKIDDAGRKVANGFVTFPVLIKDSNITKGTLYTDIDIPIARGIVLYEVDVPNSYAALPPSVTQEDVYCRIETTAQTDFDISATATLDGVTTNYIKVTYNETDGSSRARAKKAGSYVYEKAVSFTITVDSVAPTDYDLVLGTLVGDGAASLVINSYIRTPSYDAEYDYVVKTQEDWNVIIDYTAANQYRIKDNVKSIFVKSLSGGYQMTGATSPLQEGDAWGYIETNDCTRIVFEPGAFIDMHQNIGYIEVDTDYCYLEGVSVRGDTGASSAIVRSFLLNANYVTFFNCNSTKRLSNVACTIFEGSGTAKHNETTNLIGCRVEEITTSNDLYAFRYFNNITNSIIYNIDSTGGGSSIYVFHTVKNVTNSYIKELDATGGIAVIAYVENASNIYMEDFDAVLSVWGITDSYNCKNINMTDFEASGGPCYGVRDSELISNCKCVKFDATGNCNAYYLSNQLSNCYAEDIDNSGGNAYGFYDCDNCSNCTAITCDTGFYDCNYLGICFGNSNSVSGFYNCGQLGMCQGSANGVNGYDTCLMINSCWASSNGADGYNNCDTCIGSISNTNTGDGFQDCNHIEHNRASGNGGAAYNNCFADLAATRAAAVTDSGGDNA